MKKKNSYFSKKLNLTFFIILMVTLVFSLTCFIILVADAAGQHLGPNDTYVPTNKTFFDFYLVYLLVQLAYIFAYIIHLILYFTGKEKNKTNPVIENRKTPVEGEVEQNMPVPTYIYLNDKTNLEYDKKTVRAFCNYLTLPFFIEMLVVCFVFLAFAVACFFFEKVLFWIFLGAFIVFIGFVLINQFILLPNKLYKSFNSNKISNSIRLYEDRVECVYPFQSGDELTYKFFYDSSKMKEHNDLIFIRNKGLKQASGTMFRKSILEEEALNYLRDKYKK